MAEKSDCTTNGSNTATNVEVNGPEWLPGWTESNWSSDPESKALISNTLTIDTESDAGSWKQALQYSQHIKVIDDEGSVEESR